MTSAAAFTVVVPTRDRPGALGRCLESLATLDYPRERYEVVVVNDGGADDPSAVIDAYRSAFNVQLIVTPHIGPAGARNAGVGTGTHDHLAFIDDDCTAHRSWLAIMAGELETFPRSPVGGRVINGLYSNPYARTSQGLQDFLYRWYHEERRGHLPFFTTNNLAIARREFEAIGGFDSSFPFASEDRDWCDRALHSGRALHYAPGAIVYHWHDLTLYRFLEQHFRYGQGAVRFHSRRANRRGVGARLEPLAFYRGMFAAPFSTSSDSPVSEAFLTVASQSASFLGFIAEWSRSRGEPGGEA